jgi:hypothetical protein
MTTTVDQPAMTPKEVTELKSNAELLTRAIELDWRENETSAHSTDYWMRCAVEQSRAIPKLVAEVERMRTEAERLESVRDLHSPFRIYDECGHRHAETDEGVGNVTHVGLVCGDGYLYTACRHCCTDALGDQTEECASEHDHSREICPTRTALDGPAT